MKKKNIRIQFVLGLILVLSTIWVIYDTIEADIVAASSFSSPIAQAQPVTQVQDVIERNPAVQSTNCRYGVSSLDSDDYNFIQDLGVGWVLNFGVSFPALPPGVEYTPIVRFKPQLDGNGNRTGDYRVVTQPFTDDPGGLGPVVEAHPGTLWLIGNEVERKELQDDLMPNVYAKAYHDAYYFIKERDPSAQIAISGLVEVTPGRLQYLDIVWNSYLELYGTSMPVDVWNMHIYVLPERHRNGADSAAAIALGTDPAIAILSTSNPNECSASNVYCWSDQDNMKEFKQQVVAMRQWMKNHGQQNKPLILSEYSIISEIDIMDENGAPFSRSRVQTFMRNTFDYFESAEARDANLGYPKDNNRLIQQSLWFTIYISPLFSSNLAQSDYIFEPAGMEFRNKIDIQRPFKTNPLIDHTLGAFGKTETLTETTSVTIAAALYNNGDTATTSGTNVRFYADAAKTELIGTAVMPSGLVGCIRGTEQVSVVWNDLDAGDGVRRYSYWAEVEGGNTVEGSVTIMNNPEEIFLPVTFR